MIHEGIIPFARESVQRVSELFSGEVFINESATVNSFIKNGLNAKILHLAMHGIIDLYRPSFSRLVFFGDNEEAHLYTNQVYGLPLNCDLVVLGACNTGVGKLISGDGIQNMSRAFSFAGAKNIIMSLWGVPDVQTAQLNYSFFSKIRDGEPIDAALQKEKLQFFEESPELRAHPYYWAGLVANGSMEGLQFDEGLQFSFVEILSYIFALFLIGCIVKINN